MSFFYSSYSRRADPTHGTTECWWVTLTCVVYGLPTSNCYSLGGGEKRAVLGGQKRAFLGGPKSPILARGHMGKTAVFNQIVLYLETPKRDNLTPSRPLQALTPICKNKKGPPRPFGPIELIVEPAAIVKEAYCEI